MKRWLLFLALIFVFSKTYSQINLLCVDSLMRPPDPYFNCYDSYNPVCGCDSQTYRNDCFAYNKAGLNYRRQGICGSMLFDIDLVPVPVQVMPAIFSIAIRIPLSAYIYIIDVFGATSFTANLHTSYNDEIKSFEIDMHDFRDGVYVLVAVVEGEKKYIKFIKVTN